MTWIAGGRQGHLKFSELIVRQVTDIKSRGFGGLLRKSAAILGLLLAVPIVVLARLISPLVLVRFAPLWSSRIGHFAANTEVYLCERDAGMHGSRVLDVFYHSSLVSNQQLKKMWDRTLCVSSLANRWDQVNRWLPGSRNHEIPWREDGDIDVHGLLAQTEPHLAFSEEEERLGRAGLLGIGVQDGAQFICFHSRDSSYLDTTMPLARPEGWQYHNYRDTKIQNYVSAAEELTERGYFALRMGAVVKEPLKIGNPKIVDYATRHRTDFLDIYLSAKCSFFICASDGLAAIPMIFRRPTLWVDYIPLAFVPNWGPDDLILPKKLRLRAESRFITLSQIIESGVCYFSHTQQYEKLGIEVVDNTPEEITAAALEMDDRLAQRWQPEREDEDLQARFWSLIEPTMAAQVNLSRIGAEFLRQNRWFLE